MGSMLLEFFLVWCSTSNFTSFASDVHVKGRWAVRHVVWLRFVVVSITCVQKTKDNITVQYFHTYIHFVHIHENNIFIAPHKDRSDLQKLANKLTIQINNAMIQTQKTNYKQSIHHRVRKFSLEDKAYTALKSIKLMVQPNRLQLCVSERF